MSHEDFFFSFQRYAFKLVKMQTEINFTNNTGGLSYTVYVLTLAIYSCCNVSQFLL